MNFLSIKPYILQFIAEVKIKSPSMGVLGSMDDFEERIQSYEEGGADALSLVTEPTLFGGNKDMISRAKKVTSLPILAKDFIISQSQIKEYKSIGASAVLIIAKIIRIKKLNELIAYAQKVDIDPIVEVQNEVELRTVLKTACTCIAVNARNLHDFSVDIKSACKLLKRVPTDRVKLAFSGVKTKREIDLYKNAGAQGILIGTTLMKSRNPTETLQKLKGINDKS